MVILSKRWAEMCALMGGQVTGEGAIDLDLRYIVSGAQVGVDTAPQAA